MKFNRQELLKALTATRPGLAKNEVVAQAAHFVFTGADIGTYNESLCVIYPFETDFVCSVKGEEFYKLLSGIKEEEVSVELKDDRLKIRSKSTQASLSTSIADQEKIEDVIESLKIKGTKKGFWSPLPKDFKDGVYLCMFSASKDLTQGPKSCLAVTNNHIYSTDNMRISSYEMKDEISEELLFPAKNAGEIINFEVIEYGKSKGWVHFRTESGAMINTKTVQVKEGYPYDDIIPWLEEEVETFELPAELKNIIQNISVLAEGDLDIGKSVSVTIDDGLITCKAEQDHIGWVTKMIDVDYSGEPLEFNVTPVLFAQIMEKTTNFGLIGNKAFFITENFKHIISLPKK